jgi:hypothetical protein
MTTLEEGVTPYQIGSPLGAFSGAIARTKTGPLYRAGLAVVAFAMVLLPLIYLALIAFTAWAVLWHLTNDTWMFSESSGGIIRLIVYLGPAVAGGILVFFMVKPFFAARAKTPEPIALDPAKEPLLFAFVQKICGLVGAPAPCRIDVDCQVNASASLRRGLWSKDLVLTVGLPLATGLEMRQFAGVLAHGSATSRRVRACGCPIPSAKSISGSRASYERDAWDVKLERSAKRSDWRIAIVLQVARGCVWLSRRILWALMHAGHAISCFMLRQMEYDADSYEAKLAGSDAYKSTASRLRVLNVATQTAYADVRQSWVSNRLPENLPLLINHKARSLPAEVLQRLSTSAASEKTGWFDTHPCDADRIRAVQRLNEPGVFWLTEPATGLFSDFADLSKRVTRHQYEKHFQLEFTDQNLMPAEEILRESAASAEAEAMVRKYYGSVNVSLKPLLATGELPAITGDEDAVGAWREARQATEAPRAEAERFNRAWERQKRMVSLVSAHSLAKAGFKWGRRSLIARERNRLARKTAARIALEETRAVMRDRLTKLRSVHDCAAPARDAGARLAQKDRNVPAEKVQASGRTLRCWRS